MFVRVCCLNKMCLNFCSGSKRSLSRSGKSDILLGPCFAWVIMTFIQFSRANLCIIGSHYQDYNADDSTNVPRDNMKWCSINSGDKQCSRRFNKKLNTKSSSEVILKVGKNQKALSHIVCILF